MKMTSIGDMAHILMLRTRSAQLKASIASQTEELATGRTSDIASKLGGDYSYLNDIDYNLSRLDGFAVAATEATFFAQASQFALERMQGVAGSLGLELLTVVGGNLETARILAGDKARAALDIVLSELNSSAGGRSLFAGVATDTNPMESSETLLAALKAEIAGIPTTSQILQAIDDWFDDPSGFRAVMYSGSDQPLSPIQVGLNEQVSVSLHADDPEFRAVLRNAAVAALAMDSTLGLNNNIQITMLSASGEGLLNARTDLIGLRARVGSAEARIEEASSRNAAARTSLEIAKNDLLNVDPFDVAIRLQETQFQLESLFAVRVRTSRLTLLSFMK